MQRPEFDAAKAAGKLDANLGRLPLLEVDGQVFGQSKTIERFVAKRVGMMGATPIEEAQIDCICEHLRDCKDKYMKRRDKSFHSYRIYRPGLPCFSHRKAKTNPAAATEMPEFMAKVEDGRRALALRQQGAGSPTRPPSSSSRSLTTTSRLDQAPSRVAPRSPRRSGGRAKLPK